MGAYAIVTVIGALAGATIAGVGWRLFEHALLSQGLIDTVSLEWGDPYAMQVHVVNNSAAGIAKVMVSVTDVKEKSKDGSYIHNLAWFPFSEVALRQEPDPPFVLPNDRLRFEVARMHIVDPAIMLFAGREITWAGEWELTLKCVWEGQSAPLLKKLRFKWQPGGTAAIVP